MNTQTITGIQTAVAHTNLRCECHECVQTRWKMLLISEADKFEPQIPSAMEKLKAGMLRGQCTGTAGKTA